MEKSYKYLGFYMLILIPLIFVGFYKTYFVQFPNFEPRNNGFIHFHALVASIWIFMLIIQPILILRKKYTLHRSIGTLSYFVFPILILSFVPQIIRNVNEGHVNNTFFPIADSSLLIIFYALAIYYRNKSTKHMRYMIAVSLVFLGPTIGRIGPILLGWSEFFTQNIQYLLTYSVLAGLIFLDKSKKRHFKPYIIAIIGFVVHQVVYFIIFA